MNCLEAIAKIDQGNDKSFSTKKFNKIYNLSLPEETKINISVHGYVVDYPSQHPDADYAGIGFNEQFQVVWREYVSNFKKKETIFWIEPIYQDDSLSFSPEECIKDPEILYYLKRLQNPSLPQFLQNYFIL